MSTTLHRLTLTFRPDDAVDAVFTRKGRERRHHKIHARFDDDGWQQWGESHRIIADNFCLMERIQALLAEDHLT